MAGAAARNHTSVVVAFEEVVQVLTCDRHMTMAQVRQQWQNATGRTIPVAFFAQDVRYLSDDLTIEQALINPSSVSLELRAIRTSKYHIQVYGWEYTNALFEVAPTLTPAAVRRDIARAVEIYTDDFRLTYNGDELDQELPFNEQGLEEEAQLMVDLRVIVKVNYPENNETKTLECRCSDSVGDLQKQLNLDDDMAIVSTSPYRRVLENPLHVCHIVSELLDLEIPVHLTAERKMMLTFEPITFEHLRQQLPVALSCTPLDIYDLVSERFQLATEFRLAVAGQELDNCKPLLDQLIDVDDVIQVDILRPFLVSDMWKSIVEEDSFEMVYLYSTESSYALYLRDEINDQMLFYDDINLTIFGSVVDVFGAISGTEKPVMLVDRDVQREFPILTFDRVMKRLGWARDMLIDIVPTTGGLLPNEVMRSGHLLPSHSTLNNLRLTEDTLMITDSDTVFISSDKRLQMLRFAHGAIYGDVRERLRRLKGRFDVGLRTRDWHIPIEAMDRKLERELLFLTSASEFQTKLTVTMNGQWFGCWFRPQQVTFTDVMIKVGKKANVMPRLLFSKKLFCCGCGRQVSQKEEPHQMIPAACCSVKSLQLTDRRTKDVGIQSAGSRKQSVVTFTLDPETKDACVDTKSEYRRAVVSTIPDLQNASVGTKSESGRIVISATSDLERAAAASPPPSALFCVKVQSPDGKMERKTLTVKGRKGGDLLSAANPQFTSVPFGDSPVIFSQEKVYKEDNMEGRALFCFDEKTGHELFNDLYYGGRKVNFSPSFLRYCLRFLHPSSPLPSSPTLPPLIDVRTTAEFLTIDPQRQLHVVAAAALQDPFFVALLLGIRSEAQIFWRLNDGYSFVNSNSGQVFQFEEIPEGSKHVFLLLKDGDPVPCCEVPRGKVLRVFGRASLKLRVERGYVRCEGCLQLSNIDLWHRDELNDTFVKNLTAAASK